MAHVRSAIPVVLTVGAGFVGYRYIYRSKLREPLQISDDATVKQSLRVWLTQSRRFPEFLVALVVTLPFLCQCVGKSCIVGSLVIWQASSIIDSFYHNHNLLQFVICATDIKRNCFGCQYTVS